MSDIEQRFYIMLHHHNRYFMPFVYLFFFSKTSLTIIEQARETVRQEVKLLARKQVL